MALGVHHDPSYSMALEILRDDPSYNMALRAHAHVHPYDDDHIPPALRSHAYAHI